MKCQLHYSKIYKHLILNIDKYKIHSDNDLHISLNMLLFAIF